MTTTTKPISLNGIRRAGVGYVANLLRSGGVVKSQIGHGLKVDQFTARSSIHIVRHPLDHIASLLSLSREEWLPICEEFKRVNMTDSDLTRSMRYYYDGNKHQKSLSVRTLRIETITPGTVKDFFGVDIDDVALSAEVNKRKHKKLVWGDLKREDIRLSIAVADLARLYGYDTPIIEDNRICGGCI